MKTIPGAIGGAGPPHRRKARFGFPFPVLLGLARFSLVVFGLPILGFFLLLLLLPPLFGKEPAVTVSRADQAMCALDADGSAAIVVGGDSRALYHVIPALIDSATGRKCVNVAQWLHFGGDPTTLVNVLRRYPIALDAKPVILLSITLDGVNDLGFKGIPMATLMNWSPWDHFRTALHRPKAYPLFFAGSMLPAIGTMLMHRLKGERFTCDDRYYKPPRLEINRGFEPYEGRKTEGFWMLPGREKDYQVDGGNWKAFQRALDWLNASQAERIVVFNAPIDTAWLRATDGPVAMAMEARFSDMLAREVARHPKSVLLDFHRHPLPQLADSLFYDQTHLNHEGAIVFSHWLGNWLSRQGFQEHLGTK